MTVKLLRIAGAAFALWMAAASAADASSIFLTVTWYEREGDWAGVWSPNNQLEGNGQYRALWRKGSEETAADLTITLIGPASVAGQDVQIVRQSRSGRCDYAGRLVPVSDPTVDPRHWRAFGTFTCSRGPLLRWSARIDLPPPLSADDSGAILLDAPDDRLSKRWQEREGDWVGIWIPRNASHPDGEYHARWHKGNNEWESAFLKISINHNAVTVVRTGPRGQCTYTGTFSDRRTVAGWYRCAWDHRRNTWSATVED